MAVHPSAGAVAPGDQLVNVVELVDRYYQERPDSAAPAERVSFGTSGHRGSSLARTFNEAHVLAITQAICEYRTQHGIDGPLYLGKDTHALSGAAFMTALEVLAARGVHTMVDHLEGYTPTPAISHAILTHNRGRTSRLADGIVITPSHNPPEDGGLKYNPPTGGPADTTVTRWIQDRANDLLAQGVETMPRVPHARARQAPTTHAYDYVGVYVRDLVSVIDMDAIRVAGLRIAVDPLGGASVAFWHAIAEQHGLDLEIVKTVRGRHGSRAGGGVAKGNSTVPAPWRRQRSRP
jgi:phosphoglucomutase